MPRKVDPNAAWRAAQKRRSVHNIKVAKETELQQLKDQVETLSAALRAREVELDATTSAFGSAPLSSSNTIAFPPAAPQSPPLPSNSTSMDEPASTTTSDSSKKRPREPSPIQPSSSTSRPASSSPSSATVLNASGGDGVASSSRTTSSTRPPKARHPPPGHQPKPSKPITNEDLVPILEALGKECATLSRLVAPTTMTEDPDVPCAVCDDHLDDVDNEILFCDGPGCEVAVHQECYGVSRIPEGKWYCEKCLVEQHREEGDPVVCVLCHGTGGAFKPTTGLDEHAHVLCSSYVPGVSFKNHTLEPVLGTAKAVEERKKLRCSICRIKGGAPIQCAEKKCFVAFHVMCARGEGLLESMAQEGPTLLPDFERGAMPRAWCEKHRHQILVDNHAQKLKRAEDNAKGRSTFAQIKASSSTDAATAAQKLADLCNSTLRQLGSAPTSTSSSSRPCLASTSAKSSVTLAPNSISSIDPESDDPVSPPPKRLKSSHDDTTDGTHDLESSQADSNDLKTECQRLKAELEAEKTKSASYAQTLKSRFQTILRDKLAANSEELTRLRAAVSTSSSQTTAPAPPTQEDVEKAVHAALKKRDKEYRVPMAALQHYQRIEKYWVKEAGKLIGVKTEAEEEPDEVPAAAVEAESTLVEERATWEEERAALLFKIAALSAPLPPPPEVPQRMDAFLPAIPKKWIDLSKNLPADAVFSRKDQTQEEGVAVWVGGELDGVRIPPRID